MKPIETTRMSTRGQVIIPKKIRDQVKLEEDDLFAVSATDKNTIILKRFDRKQWAEDLRKLRESIDINMSMDEINAEIKAYRRDRHKRSSFRNNKTR
jgi:AbrB family looped-hinge helix DNA binding protein